MIRHRKAWHKLFSYPSRAPILNNFCAGDPVAEAQARTSRFTPWLCLRAFKNFNNFSLRTFCVLKWLKALISYVVTHMWYDRLGTNLRLEFFLICEILLLSCKKISAIIHSLGCHLFIWLDFFSFLLHIYVFVMNCTIFECSLRTKLNNDIYFKDVSRLTAVLWQQDKFATFCQMTENGEKDQDLIPDAFYFQGMKAFQGWVVLRIL